MRSGITATSSVSCRTGVEMTDDVEYRLPFGPLGRLVHWLVVRHQLRAIFDYRTSAIARRFPTMSPVT